MVIKATSLEEAVELAKEGELPEASYIDGSFEVGEDFMECYAINKISIEKCKVDATPKKDLPLLIGTLETKAGEKYLEKKIRGRK